MKLSSKRVDITPLNLEEMKIFIKSRGEYERHANLKVTGVEVDELYCEEIKELMEREPGAWTSKNKEYIFHTLWLVIDKTIQTIIGQFYINGRPDENGDVEIFFSIETPFRQKGYATEVMLEILKWGYKTKLFRKVLIEADEHNKAAMASLNKLGFKKIPEDEDGNQSTKFYKIVYTKEPCVDDFEVDPIWQ